MASVVGKLCISLDQLMQLENVLDITRFSQTSEMALDFFSPSCISWFHKMCCLFS